MFLDFKSEVESLLHSALDKCGFKVEEGVTASPWRAAPILIWLLR